MKIVRGWPPNIDAIAAVLPEARSAQGVLFCYGDTIFVPDGGGVSYVLRMHEAVHSRRQAEVGVEVWWRRYLAEPQFRFDEELPAHRAEYEAFCENDTGRGRRIAFLDMLARRLSGPLYGSVINFAQAKRAIGGGVMMKRWVRS